MLSLFNRVRVPHLGLVELVCIATAFRLADCSSSVACDFGGLCTVAREREDALRFKALSVSSAVQPRSLQKNEGAQINRNRLII
jgi:hypothetical protein